MIFLVFIHVRNDSDAALFEPQLATIIALTKGGKSAKVVRSPGEIPEGCGASVVTSTVTVHTLVRGLVDLDVEIAKCDKKLDLARINHAKIVKTESQADYATTVPENVRLANEDKVCCISFWQSDVGADSVAAQNDRGGDCDARVESGDVQ